MTSNVAAAASSPPQMCMKQKFPPKCHDDALELGFSELLPLRVVGLCRLVWQLGHTDLLVVASVSVVMERLQP